MLTDDIWEKYLVLDSQEPVSLDELINVQINQSQMEQVKESCKITKIISDKEAQDIYLQLKCLKPINKWRNQESKLYLWIIVKLYIQQQFDLREIPLKIWKQVGLYINKPIILLQKQWQQFASTSVSPFKQWNKQEDDYLIKLVRQHNLSQFRLSWSKISLELSQNAQNNYGTFRTGKKCRDRWLNFLDQSLQNKQWNDNDTLQLFQYVSVMGRKWFQISGLMVRTENFVKNKFYGLLTKYKTTENCLLLIQKKIKYERKLQQFNENSINNYQNIQTFDQESGTFLKENQSQGEEEQFSLDMIKLDNGDVDDQSEI